MKFYWELEKGAMTISSHRTGRAWVHLAPSGHLARHGQGEETRGNCLTSVFSFFPGSKLLCAVTT